MSLERAAPSTGLSSSDAAVRLRRDGPNALPEPERRSRLAIVAKVLREPMLLLLLATTGVYLVLGEPGEALALGISVLAVIGLTIYQEHKAERALQALRAMGAPRARVLRDGAAVLVDARDIVVGDLLVLGEGDRIAADATVLDEADLHADQSMLTGESVPVRCPPGTLVHAGTLVVRGHGRAEVVATGLRTEMGRIGVELRQIKSEPTPMQRQIRRVVLLFAALALLSCAVMFVIYGATRGDWMEALLAGLTLAMSNIPEEFPVVLTVFLALGAWRMARHAALVRRAPAIEAMGAITVLCTDKTGTLTENRMRLAELATPGSEAGPLPSSPDLRELLRVAAKASPRHTHDPMEIALHDAAAQAGIGSQGPQREREYPFSAALPVVAVAWRDASGVLEVASKGAPETIAMLCRLDEGERAARLATVEAMAARGLRVLGVAVARPAPAPLPPTPEGFDYRWCGLVAFADPLREGVAAAVAEARAAGVRVIMLTGDHLATAGAIARQAGIATAGGVLPGARLEDLADDALGALAASGSVFARVKPHHKLRLVEALKARGDVVAMTGDGVNDAPALMAAHVGIAMGGRGTDVAREAAAIVLLDDNFVTVVRAIRLGRTIYDNILRAMRYILAVHVPITGLALLPLFTGGPLVLLPLHVVFLELIIDPACSIVLEREPAAADVMQRPPRPVARPLLTARVMATSLAQGAVVFAAAAAALLTGDGIGLAPGQSGALAFSALVAGNLGLLLLYREGDTLWRTLRQPNPAFWWVAAGAMGVLALATRMPVAAAWLGFAPPPLVAWVLALALPLACTVAMKALSSKRGASAPAPG